MVGANESADLRVQCLSPAFRRKYWTRNAREPDTDILWSGLKKELARWLAGERSVVVAVLTTTEAVASRSVFSRSLIRDDLWYYGYFYTSPDFRRLGLGERVMRHGLLEIERAGARYCSCYVAIDNRASADLAVKLGFRRLPFVRVVFRGSEDAARHAIRLSVAESDDVGQLAGAADLIDKVVGGSEGAPVVTEELLVRKPWQPWKSAENRLVRLEHEGQRLGIARIGPHKAVLLPDMEVFSGHPMALMISAVSALSGDSLRPVHVFLPRAALNDVLEYPCQITREAYDVMWHAHVSHDRA